MRLPFTAWVKCSDYGDMNQYSTIMVEQMVLENRFGNK